MRNREYERRLIELYEKDPRNFQAIGDIMQTISIGSSAENAKLESIKLNELDRVVKSKNWDETDQITNAKLKLALELGARNQLDLSNSSLLSQEGEKYMRDRMNELGSAIASSNSSSYLVSEIMEAQISQRSELVSIRGGGGKSTKSTSSELPLSMRMNSLMSNNAVQEVGRAGGLALGGKFSSKNLLKSITPDLPGGLGGWINKILSNHYDLNSRQEIVTQIVNPNKPQIQVDNVICFLKDLSKPEVPPFEIIHQPKGLSQSHSHSFSSSQVIGRTSPIMGYQNSGSSISFEFQVHEDFQPFTIEETVNFLTGLTYPEYDLKSNRIIPARVLCQIGQFTEVLVIESIGVSYQENPIRDGRYISASISMSAQIVPASEGDLAYKSRYYTGNPYAENKVQLQRGDQVFQSLTNEGLAQLSEKIDNLLAPIDQKVNELGSLVLERSSKFLEELGSKARDLLGLNESLVSKPGGFERINLAQGLIDNNYLRNRNIQWNKELGGISKNSYSQGFNSIGSKLSFLK